jgi:Xaa-Pro aminopeptidase
MRLLVLRHQLRSDERVAERVAPPGELAQREPDPFETGRHDLPVSEALAEFMRGGWAAQEPPGTRALAPAARCAERRARLSEQFAGERLVVPAGRATTRGNGQQIRFRPASDYVYLSGDGSEGGVLVLEPTADGHEARLFLRPHSDRSTLDFFSDHLHGELWVGARPPLDDVAASLELECSAHAGLGDALSAPAPTRVLRGLDPEVDGLVDAAGRDGDRELRAACSELRLVKDAWEVEQVERAIATTIRGFEDVARVLPAALAGGGERQVEATFSLRALVEGNGPAFAPIAAGGAHATTLHWTRNDAPLRADDLLLLDAGAESATLYAADLTRTLPVGGAFSEPQRRLLEIVNAALDAGIAAVAPGRPFRDFHRAVAAVLADGLDDWGLLPVAAAESLDPESGLHRRYTLCAPGHMLGLDVHDCPHARAATYLDGVLEPGQVLTVEPGLYFQPDDLTLPPGLRGLGARVEDDVVVTGTGCRVLSTGLPRRPDEVEAWIAGLRAE